MSNPNLSNPEKLVNEARLNEYHQTILPYLGGHIECGFTPVGAVIMMSGNEAPKHYLKCDGTVYNIADYPELAAFYARSQGSCNFYGGNGTTTFAVPDLRGEFLRGTGSNRHANQGSGAAVGTHQDATVLNGSMMQASAGKVSIRKDASDDWQNLFQTPDAKYQTTSYVELVSTKSIGTYTDTQGKFSTRPTNTSVLFCVASKNIYLDARFDYSLEEKVVGEWIDGKPLYQRVITGTLPEITGDGSTGIRIDILTGFKSSENTLIDANGSISWTNGRVAVPWYSTNKNFASINNYGNNLEILISNNSIFSEGNYIFKIQYTKTTD